MNEKRDLNGMSPICHCFWCLGGLFFGTENFPFVFRTSFFGGLGTGDGVLSFVILCTQNFFGLSLSRSFALLAFPSLSPAFLRNEIACVRTGSDCCAAVRGYRGKVTAKKKKKDHRRVKERTVGHTTHCPSISQRQGKARQVRS